VCRSHFQVYIKTTHNKTFFNDGTSTACGNTSGMAQLFGTAQKYKHIARTKVLNYKRIFYASACKDLLACLSLGRTSTLSYKYAQSMQILQTTTEKQAHTFRYEIIDMYLYINLVVLKWKTHVIKNLPISFKNVAV
jgi:hypothetical protein